LVNINTFTGLTINGNLTVTGLTTSNAISANTITASTISGGTLYGDGSNLTGISAAATEFVVNCRNQSGSNMYRGQVVYMNGSTGNKPTILLAQANSEMTSARTFGVLKNDIANNADGDVVTIGSITNLDTRTSATHPFTIDTLSDGQTIYLSPTNAGYITNVKPYAPNHLVYIGKVVRTSPTNGYIEYQIQNGYELDELHDVKITGVTYGDLMVYSGYNGSNVWVNTKTLNGSYTMTGLTVNGNVSIPSVTGATIDTDKFLVSDSGIIKFRTGTKLLSDIGGVGGSGTADYVARFTGASTLGDGIIQDNGTTVGINATPVSDSLLYLSVNPPFLGTPEDYVIKAVNNPFGGSSSGLFGISSTVTNSNGGATSGVFNANSGSDDATGGVFNATSTFSKTAIGVNILATGGTNNYSVQLQDGTQAINRVLVSRTIDGKANWSSSLIGLTLVDTNALTVNGNLTVTGGTQSLFSGNSSSDLVRITQTGTGNAFVVEDSNSPDATPFVINASGNTAIGLSQTIGDDKLTVSGNTSIYGTLSVTTVSATTYQNLPKVAFSPMNVGVCDTAPTAATTQYYYQSIAEVTTTLSKVKLWGFSGSDLVLFGLYRGTLQGTMTLIGQARGTCGVGPNELTFTAETGQNLTVVAGENLVVGYFSTGTSWRTVYNTGISDVYFGILNTADITTMPATPTGTATGIRFACTLY
jgi:hypothetical protein